MYWIVFSGRVGVNEKGNTWSLTIEFPTHTDFLTETLGTLRNFSKNTLSSSNDYYN